MIWLLFLCSNLILEAATLTGRLETPKGEEAVVWLEPVKPAATLVPSSSKIIIHQRNKTFSPHLAVARSGDSIAFPNDDPFFHNAFSNYSGQVFDTGLYPPRTTKVIPLRRPGIIRVFCNIHPTMSAVIVVVDTPYFAITGKDGAYVIPDVPPGEYTMRFFSERATPAALEELSRQIIIGESGSAAVPALSIPDAGTTRTAKHKNKYGKDYPAVIVDLYPGGKP